MFGLFKPKALPSAREVAIMIPLGLKDLELETSHRVEWELKMLRKQTHEEIARMLRFCRHDGIISGRYRRTPRGSRIQFLSRSICLFLLELRALGYQASYANAGLGGDIRIIVPQTDEAQS